MARESRFQTLHHSHNQIITFTFIHHYPRVTSIDTQTRGKDSSLSFNISTIHHSHLDLHSHFHKKTITQAETSVNCLPLSPSLSELWQPPSSSNVCCATTFAWPTLSLESALCLLCISLRLCAHLLRLTRTTCSPSTHRCSEP